MIRIPQVAAAQEASVLGRTSPLVKLGVAAAWLVSLVVTLDPRTPLVLTVAALAAGVRLGQLSLRDVIRGVAPLWLAALAIGIFNALFGPANADPAQAEAARLGPFRLTEMALGAGVAVGLRVIAIGAASVVFARTTDATALVDSLVQQARLPARFAYGALAAYQAVPRLSEDLVSLRQARRVRGLRAGWHPRVLVSLLVLAVRHADRTALAMDARAFGLPGRTSYREVRWSRLDAALAAAGVGVLVLALLVTRLPVVW